MPQHQLAQCRVRSTELRMPSGQTVDALGMHLVTLHAHAEAGDVGLSNRIVQRNASVDQRGLGGRDIIEQQVKLGQFARKDVFIGPVGECADRGGRVNSCEARNCQGAAVAFGV